jgi:NADH-quinone oxidoreductase subunit I
MKQNGAGRVVTDDAVGPLLSSLARGTIGGMRVTLRHFGAALADYLRGWPGRRGGSGTLVQSPAERGMFTVEYPEQRIAVPENFRYLPVLLYEEESGKIRCTSCGICAKVCPPQCIWIVRTSDPETGRPIPVPTEFYIDADICMNCGFCAEYCPFDAIIMDHDYEIASFNRNLLNMDKLLKPASYYKEIRPQNYAIQEEARKAKEAAKAAKTTEA